MLDMYLDTLLFILGLLAGVANQIEVVHPMCQVCHGNGRMLRYAPPGHTAPLCNSCDGSRFGAPEWKLSP